jgi:hypothetical protein
MVLQGLLSLGKGSAASFDQAADSLASWWQVLRYWVRCFSFRQPASCAAIRWWSYKKVTADHEFMSTLVFTLS